MSLFAEDAIEMKTLSPGMKQGEVVEVITSNFATTTGEIKALHAKVQTGERTDAELKRAVDKAAADIDALSREAASWQAQQQVAAAQVGQGPEVYRQFRRSAPDPFGAAVRLFDTTERWLGQSVPVPGLLTSETVADDWHWQAKSLLVAGRAMAAHNGKSANSLHDLQTGAPRAAAMLARHLVNGPLGLTRAAVEGLFSEKAVDRAFTGATDAAGGYAIPDEVMIPLGFVGQTGDAPLFMSDLPTETLGARSDMPVVKQLPRPSGAGAASNDDPAAYSASSAVLDKISITPAALSVRLVIDDFSMEDAIAITMADMMTILARSIRFGAEDCILNGQKNVTATDTIASWSPGGIFTTTGAGGTGDHRNQIKGLRGEALDLSNTLDMSTFSYAKILELFSKLDSPFSMSNGRRLVTSAKVLLLKMLALDQVATVDKYGPRAAVLTGELASIGGVPIRISPFATDDLASTGRYTGSGATSGLLLVDVSQHRMAIRRALSLSTERKPGKGVVELSGVQRFNRRPLQLSTAKTVAYGINIS